MRQFDNDGSAISIAVLRTGFYSALLIATFAAAALALGITTPPRSGNFCQADCITYPYTDAAAFVPTDYLWMYPAFLMTLAFVALMASLLHTSNPDRRIYARIGLSLAGLSAAALTIDYFIQLTVM